jgi:hypothetical protein
MMTQKKALNTLTQMVVFRQDKLKDEDTDHRLYFYRAELGALKLAIKALEESGSAKEWVIGI